jgi:hypothetical protein
VRAAPGGRQGSAYVTAMASAKPSVTLIGAGALGTVLARGLVRQGYRVDGILSRAAGDAERLAKQTGAGVFSSSLRDLPGEAYLVTSPWRSRCFRTHGLGASWPTRPVPWRPVPWRPCERGVPTS